MGLIRNAIIHIQNEQPLLADLYNMPVETDVSLVCTNVRMLDGKKPLFIEHTASTFVFPYLHIRFIEIMAGSVTGLPEAPLEERDVAMADGADDTETEADLELDEDFLKRIRDV